MDCSGLTNWEESKKAPEEMACFKVKANRGEAGNLVRTTEHFCVHSTDIDGNKPVQSDEDAHMLAEEWVNSIKRFAHKKALASTTNVLGKLPEELAVEDLANTKEGQTFKVELFERYSMLESVCASQVKVGAKTEEECQGQEQEALLGFIDSMCDGNAKCEELADSMISSGLLDQGRNSITGIGEDLPEIQLDKSITPATKVASFVAPREDEIQMALNTFRRIFKGAKITDLDDCKGYCEYKAENIMRNIALIPFLSKSDPWLSYLGHIRDV